MRIARFVDQAEPTYGIVEGPADADLSELSITALQGDPFFHGIQPTGTTHRLEDVRLGLEKIRSQLAEAMTPEMALGGTS